MVEKCLVVPRKALFGNDDKYAFSGFRTKDEWKVDLESVLSKDAFYAPRKTLNKEDDVEYQEDLKQIIPGVVFLYKNKIFTYSRLDGSGEKRMVGRNDILISGHVEPQDTKKTYQKTLWNALHREFNEEMIYRHSYSLDHIGYVNLDDDLLGKVHFGLVYLIPGSSPEISVKETEKHQGSLKTAQEISQLQPPLMSWHNIIFDEVKKYLK